MSDKEVGIQRQSVASATMITFGTNLLVAVLSLVNVLVVSRELGPSGRGSVALLTAIAWFTSSLATAGVEEANVNLAGTEPHLRRSLATNSVLLAVLLGAVAAGIVATLIHFVPAIGGHESPALRWLTLASLPGLILGSYLKFIVRADYGFTVGNVAWLVTPVANVVTNGVLALVGVLSVGTAIGAWIGGQMLYTLILAAYVARRLAGFGRPDARVARRALSFGLKSHIGRVMLLGNYRLDQWVLGAISGSRELGLYSVAVAWAEALWYLPTSLAYVQRPDLVRADRREAVRQSALAFRAATVVTIVLGLGMIATAPFLCVTLFGSSFHGSIVELRILVLGAVGVLALKVFGSALVAQRKPLVSSTALGVGFVITVALDALLIPPYAGIGASVASSIAYTVAGVVMIALFVRKLGGKGGDMWPRMADVRLIAARARELRRGRAAAPEGVVAEP